MWPPFFCFLPLLPVSSILFGNIVIIEDPVCRTLHIIVLTTSHSPEKQKHAYQTQKNHCGNQPENHIHNCNDTLSDITRAQHRIVQEEETSPPSHRELCLY